MSRLAVYTTLYPGVEGYLADWFRSLLRQTDQDFQLWIGVDQLPLSAIERALGSRPKAHWVAASPGDSPARVRQRALAQLVRRCDAVVLVDSDDILHPSRVRAARDALSASHVAGCALRVVDESGGDLGIVMRPPGGTQGDQVLPRNNIYGLSNSAYDCATLRRCLPIPDDAVLVDWFLVTRAWLIGARLGFDPTVRMHYRQHASNTARVRPPFTQRRVVQDTERVRAHFDIVRSAPPTGSLPERLRQLDDVGADVERFAWQVVADPEVLDRYVHELNNSEIEPLWWSCVAHPSLRHMWAAGDKAP